MSREYLLALRVSFTAEDDPKAREIAKMLKDGIRNTSEFKCLTVGAQFKLQQVFEDRAPRAISIEDSVDLKEAQSS